MSLINQMLSDLQQQKKEAATSKPKSLRPGKIERIPYLPLPLVLGGAALLLLCFVWWMAGVLSDLMFGFEPAAKSVESQQVAVVEEPLPIENALTVEEPDRLSLAERVAESPVLPVVNQKGEVATQASGITQPSQELSPVETPVKKPIEVKPQVVARVSDAKIVRRKPESVSPRVTKRVRPVQKLPAQVPRKVAAQAPKRLHPDDLPGALLSPSRSLTVTERPIAARPSKSRATTPYGVAEEAYLDGKWALQRERRNLAVRSLQHSLEIYPGHLPARELLVETLDRDGKSGEAMFLLAEGLEIAPDYIGFKKKYARMLVDQGDYDAATKVMLNGGLPTVEADPEAHVVLATLYQRLDEPFLAAQTYRNLLVAWPQTGAFWVGLGGALERQRLPEEAIGCYRRALKTKNLRQDLSRYAKKRLSLLD
jgi:MSHA biogenesis protein MshN